jgi:predicted DsbA family dithiol-disulfide isomerase
LTKIRIKMFSDYICPFCYLGKAITDKLKNRFDIEIEHVGIEIHPETPISGVDLRKWISETDEIYEHLRSRGKGYGLNFCDVKMLPNSRKSLIVGEYSRKIGKNKEFTNEIFKAYFEDCLDIGKEEVIIEVAKNIGLTKRDVTSALEDPLCQKRFTNNCIDAKKNNVTGVPTFIINDKYTIIGAQQEQTFIDLFEKIEKETAS